VSLSVFVVYDRGGYDEDAEIVDVFGSRDGVAAYMADLGPQGSCLEVKEMPLRLASYRRPQWLNMRTRLGIISGVRLPQQPGVVKRASHQYDDLSVETIVRMRYGAWEVRTTGEASAVPEAHAKAVQEHQAKLRLARMEGGA